MTYKQNKYNLFRRHRKGVRIHQRYVGQNTTPLGPFVEAREYSE